MEHDASDTHPANLPPAKVDIPRIERAVREILLAVGENPDREGLLKTPNRVARSYASIICCRSWGERTWRICRMEKSWV
jgi:GTP cyclohydrolase I